MLIREFKYGVIGTENQLIKGNNVKENIIFNIMLWTNKELSKNIETK